MPVFFEHGLKVSLSLLVVYLFYALLLKRMTYYQWNRHFLILFSIGSFLVPFIDISKWLQSQEGGRLSFVDRVPTIYGSEILGQSTPSEGMNVYWTTASAVFLIVSAILAVRLLIQFLSIRKLKSKATLLETGEVNIYSISQPILPFSFLDDIFINTTDYTEDELQEIIDHERVHVLQRHSLDMLALEMICILNWYNPIAWMVKNAVRENLEFIADDAVIRKGASRKNYQYLLLKVSGELPVGVASSLKFSSLKNRILMMNKTKDSKKHLLKFMLLAPLIAVLLLAFRNSKESVPNKRAVKEAAAESFTLSTLTYSIPNPKVRGVIIKEQDKSLLKPGELLNLSLIQDEKERLKNILEKNGYTHLKSNAIRFMIDSTSVSNSFAIEVSINVEAAVAVTRKKTSGSRDSISAYDFSTRGGDTLPVYYHHAKTLFGHMI